MPGYTAREHTELCGGRGNDNNPLWSCALTPLALHRMYTIPEAPPTPSAQWSIPLGHPEELACHDCVNPTEHFSLQTVVFIMDVFRVYSQHMVTKGASVLR